MCPFPEEVGFFNVEVVVETALVLHVDSGVHNAPGIALSDYDRSPPVTGTVVACSDPECSSAEVNISLRKCQTGMSRAPHRHHAEDRHLDARLTPSKQGTFLLTLPTQR